MDATPQARIFISYRRQDSKDAAGRLHDRLASRLGADQVFFDIPDIESGVEFRKEIERAVGACDVLLAVIGPRWVDMVDDQGRRRLDNPDDVVRLEIGAAIRRKVRVIPVLVDGATVPRQKDLPRAIQSLGRRNACRLSHETYDSDVERLFLVIDKVLGIERDTSTSVPKDVVDLIVRSNVAFTTGNYDDALRAAGRAVRLAPKNADALVIRSQVYYALDRIPEAVDDAERAVKLAPGNAAALCARSTAYCSSGRAEEALQDAERAVELSPGDPAPLSCRAEAYLALERDADAVGDADKALQLDANCTYALVIRSLALSNMDRVDEALEDADRAVEIAPRDVGALLARGRIYEIQGRYNEALDDVDRVLAAAPNTRQALLRGSTYHGWLGHRQEAVEYLDRLLTLEPDDEELREHRDKIASAILWKRFLADW